MPSSVTPSEMEASPRQPPEDVERRVLWDIAEQFNDMLTLGDNWNGAGAPAPEPAASAVCMQLALSLLTYEPDMTALPSGGVLLRLNPLYLDSKRTATVAVKNGGLLPPTVHAQLKGFLEDMTLPAPLSHESIVSEVNSWLGGTGENEGVCIRVGSPGVAMTLGRHIVALVKRACVESCRSHSGWIGLHSFGWTDGSIVWLDHMDQFVEPPKIEAWAELPSPDSKKPERTKWNRTEWVKP